MPHTQARDIEGLPCYVALQGGKRGLYAYTDLGGGQSEQLQVLPFEHVRLGIYEVTISMPTTRGLVTIWTALKDTRRQRTLDPVVDGFNHDWAGSLVGSPLQITVACPTNDSFAPDGTRLTQPTIALPGGECGCPAGYRRQAAQCLPCESGFTSPPGSTLCSEVCPPGTYAEAGSPQCFDCPAGTSSTTYGSFECTLCPSGTFSLAGSACVRCPLHSTTTSPGAGSAALCVCEAGRVPIGGPTVNGSAVCGCPVGTVYSEQLSECLDCPESTSSAPGEPRCDVCSAGHYLRDSTKVPSEEECISCSTLGGVDCGWNSTLQTVVLRDEYWRISDLSVDVRRCDSRGNGSSCLGGGTVGRCVEGQAGPLCKVCVDDSEFYDEGSGSCRACPDAGARAGRTIGVVVD